MIRLCSTSATRAKLLKEFNINFLQSKVEFDEDSIKENNPKSFVYSVAKGKLKEALKSYSLEMPLLVADTVVSANGEILRKARDREDAKRILLKQSGNSVDIITATFFKGESFEFSDISKTTYAFDNFNLDDLEEYLNSGEWIGKAGACMVEGFCKKYIKSVTGLESNAMGLPVEKLLPWLEF
jgi:septum formation protein